MKRTMQGGLRFIAAQTGLATGLFLCAGQAAAQQPYPQQYPQQAQPAYPQQPQPAYQQPQPAYQAQAQVQVAPAMPAAAAKADDTDQGRVVGHIGLGWYGTLPVPYGVAVGAAGAPGGMVSQSTPLVGMRYWLGPSLGLDAAIGFNTSSGSSTVVQGATSTSNDLASITTFALHVGVPLVLGNTQHLSVQLTPEANLGFGSNTVKVAGASDINNSGLLISVGARAGAELYFGFIGVPALSLDASVGLFLSALSGKAEQDSNSSKLSTLQISTLDFHQPWEIFTTNLAARYYF